jgi:hypothetical protein
MVAFVMLTSFKGWALDTDPLNYYYYLTLGMVFALPTIERQWLAAARRSASAVPIALPAAADEAAGDSTPVPEPARGTAMPPQRGDRPGLTDRVLRPVRRPIAPPDDVSFELGPRLRRPPGK